MRGAASWVLPNASCPSKLIEPGNVNSRDPCLLGELGIGDPLADIKNMRIYVHQFSFLGIRMEKAVFFHKPGASDLEVKHP